MAVESVPTTRTTAQVDAYDRINALAIKIRGILQVMRCTDLQSIPDDAIHDACWAAEGMLDEMAGLALDQLQQ